MARSGLYKSEVQKARASLIAQGVHPSIDAVRVALGNTGSKTTIHRYLKEIDAEENAGVGGKVAVSDALNDLVGRLAARLHEEAETLITEAKQRSDAALQERAAAIERQQQEIAALSTQLQHTEVSLQTEQAANTDTQKQLQDRTLSSAQMEERVQGLTVQLAERKAHAESLEAKHQHARDALELYRNSAKEQREQDQRRHEHQVQELQVALHQANESLAAKNQDLLTLNRDNARMLVQNGQLDKEGQQLRHEKQRLEIEAKELHALEGEHQKLRVRLEQAMREDERLGADLTAAQASLEKERERRANSEAELTRLQGRTQALEAIVAELKPHRDGQKQTKKTNS